MKITVNKNNLLNILSKLQGITSRKSSLAITETVLMKAFNSTITIIATDLETGFEGSISAEVEEEGIIAINAKKLYEIARDFPENNIYIKEIENYWIEIEKNNIEFHIVGMNPDNFPAIPQIKNIDFFKIDSQSLKEMIEKVIIIGPSSKDKRAHIAGIVFEKIEKEDKKKIRLVSTDGNRLSLVDYIYKADIELPSIDNIIIPKKGISEVVKFLDSEGDVFIGFKDNHCIIKKENETITIRLLEGDFPKYDDIINESEKNNIIKIKRSQFLMMLKRMSILSDDDYNNVIFKFSDNKLVITSTNPEIGESKEDIYIDYDKNFFEVAFNPKFFIDVISIMKEDNIMLNIINEKKPCLIEGEKDKTWLSIIMPMRI